MKRILLILISAFTSILLYAQNDISLNTLVIDAGHGGKDPGAVSHDRSAKEKDFTLDIATRVAEKVREAYPGINVVMTRTTDEFVSLEDRADIANKAAANLFMSIHINASTSWSPNGYSVHVLGQSSMKDRDLFAYNMDVVKRENSVIMLEDNYNTKYQGFGTDDSKSFIFLQLMQNANLEQSLKFATIIAENLKQSPITANRGIWQNPFYVLWKTSMPAVLVELGFISNSSDLDTLKDEENRDALAQALFESFRQYKNFYDSSVGVGDNFDNKKTVKNFSEPKE